MLNPKNIIALLFVVGTFLLGYFGMLDTWNAVGERKVEVAQAEARLRVAEEDLRHNQRLMEFYNGLSQDVRDKIVAALPQDTDLPNLLAHIDRIAKTSGVLLSNMTIRKTETSVGFAAEQAEAGAPSSLLSFRAQGGYTSTKEFLRSLEVFLRIVDVDTIILSSASTSGAGEPILDITLTARTYELTDSL